MRYFCRPLEGDVNPPYFFLPHEEYTKMRYFGDNDGETRILTEDDVETLTKCLRRMLMLDPEQRAKAAEFVSDPCFKG
jgi:hypothetical protein